LEAEELTPGPIGVGTQIRPTGLLAGTVLPLAAAFEFATVRRLTISVDFTGHGIGKILVPLMVRREARKEMPGNIAALKQLIETS
jgi:hypothetical protein